MSVKEEFSRFASEYDRYNIIQEKVVTHLLSKVSTSSKRIVDLGCGRGGVCSKLSGYESFLGVDFSQNMLDLHPKSSETKLICADFNDASFLTTLKNYQADLIISASALQWAEDLASIFEAIRGTPFALAIFTSNTFATLNRTAGIDSMLRSSSDVIGLAERILGAKSEVVHYKLEFANTKEIFSYIKRSGVSGSRRVLSYKESKRLLLEYPLSYLEFEVVFLHKSATI